jgi:Fe-S-cluster containining protein
MPDPAVELCPACGLGCNGVLFAELELQRDDRASELAALGLEIQCKGRKQAFAQPCLCFDGQRCPSHAHRPRRCRTFECGVLKHVRAEKLTPLQALRLINQVRRQVHRVQDQLHALGNHDDVFPFEPPLRFGDGGTDGLGRR